MKFQGREVSREIRDRKAAQRRAGIIARRGLPQAERAAANADICACLLAMPCFQKAENLLLYAAFGGEVNLAELAEQAARLGKTVAYPVCGENFTLTAESGLEQLKTEPIGGGTAKGE